MEAEKLKAINEQAKKATDLLKSLGGAKEHLVHFDRLAGTDVRTVKLQVGVWSSVKYQGQAEAYIPIELLGMVRMFFADRVERLQKDFDALKIDVS